MKFLHTADWQISMRFVHLANEAEAARRARLQAVTKVLKLAADEHVDFVLVAGDTFEDNGVERAKVQEVAKRLGSAPAPVFVIPGNHDPAGTGSVWEDVCWKGQANVHVLLTPAPVRLPGGGTLFPCPALGKHSAEDPTAWIRTGVSDGIRIGVAHGSVLGNPDIESSFPIPREAPERCGLDYLALGHHHSTAVYDDPFGTARIAYSGAHEPTAFGERDSGNVLLVEIDRPGAAPRVRKATTKVLTWLDVERTTVRDTASLEELASYLESIPDPESTLVKCTLRGFAPADGAGALERIREAVGTRFLYGELECSALDLESAGPEWVEGLPPGYLRDAARALQAQAPNDRVSAMALEDFRRIWKGVRV